MIYSVEETAGLLKEMLQDKILVEDLLNTFYFFLDVNVDCDEQDFLVEALPGAKYNPATKTFSEEKMVLTLTRQYKRYYEDEYWQTSLNIYFTMNDYFKKYELNSKHLVLTLIKVVLNLHKNSIWATSEKKEKQIKKLIKDVISHGIYESYDVDCNYTG